MSGTSARKVRREDPASKLALSLRQLEVPVGMLSTSTDVYIRVLLGLSFLLGRD